MELELRSGSKRVEIRLRILIQGWDCNTSNDLAVYLIIPELKVCLLGAIPAKDLFGHDGAVEELGREVHPQIPIAVDGYLHSCRSIFVSLGLCQMCRYSLGKYLREANLCRVFPPSVERSTQGASRMCHMPRGVPRG